MRADRLLSLLMLLQTRGSMTALALAGELEVTERTIYRDITALSAAGVPVYTERGPGGGISLLESYHTNLTGLNPQEVRALFMLNIPTALEQLGVGAELRTALLKLSAALPKNRRADEIGSRQRIHLDPGSDFTNEVDAPVLKTLYSAVRQDQVLNLWVHSAFGTPLEMRVFPYGLVSLNNYWHLVCAVNRQTHNMRVIQTTQITSAALTSESFQRPVDFDLPIFWKNWREENASNRSLYPVRALVSPVLAQILAENRSETLQSAPDFSGKNWQEITLYFENLESARMRILGYGGAIEVLEPLALRQSVMDFAHQIQVRYHTLLD